MKRPFTMIVAGVLTTISVVAGTLVAYQTGVFASATTTIQPNGDIVLPTALPSTESSQAAVEQAPADTPVNTPAIDPTKTAEPTVETVEVVDSSREAALLEKLNEAYRIMKQRDQAYQAKLKEAYDKLQATAATSSGVVVNNNPAPAQQPPTPPRSEHEDEHAEDQHKGEDQHRDEDKGHDQDKGNHEDHQEDGNPGENH